MYIECREHSVSGKVLLVIRCLTHWPSCHRSMMRRRDVSTMRRRRCIPFTRTFGVRKVLVGHSVLDTPLAISFIPRSVLDTPLAISFIPKNEYVKINIYRERIFVTFALYFVHCNLLPSLPPTNRRTKQKSGH